MQSNLRGQRHFLGIAAFSRDYVRMPATGGHSSSEFRTQSSLSPTRSWFSRISGIFDSSPARMPRHRRAFEFGIQSSELRARPTIVPPHTVQRLLVRPSWGGRSIHIKPLRKGMSESATSFSPRIWPNGEDSTIVRPESSPPEKNPRRKFDFDAFCGINLVVSWVIRIPRLVAGISRPWKE